MFYKMKDGCFKFEHKGKKYHATLCKHYLPHLDCNREEQRKNENGADNELTFFDLNRNVWVTIEC
ncbi:hypothetical protein phiST2_0240 [Vibrio phage phi-ST2]|nr:hypothetical protein phiST2_0240 [Vibrio phage phi-ST2]QNJ54722.1 hypothetical protein vBValMR10Z_182 [Vibrio phage vB_ValM_R10Z]QNJ55109.1 hypothetical protein vBValMR11Z_183 [Vibrio phage vB_ValM_R11Z]URQ03575.1 hypothetical protein PVA23_198 [Vibrio phage PVA23]